MSCGSWEITGRGKEVVQSQVLEVVHLGDMGTSGKMAVSWGGERVAEMQEVRHHRNVFCLDLAP
jgi:hypothetical protein